MSTRNSFDRVLEWLELQEGLTEWCLFVEGNLFAQGFEQDRLPKLFSLIRPGESFTLRVRLAGFADAIEYWGVSLDEKLPDDLPDTYMARVRKLGELLQAELQKAFNEVVSPSEPPKAHIDEEATERISAALKRLFRLAEERTPTPLDLLHRLAGTVTRNPVALLNLHNLRAIRSNPSILLEQKEASSLAKALEDMDKVAGKANIDLVSMFEELADIISDDGDAWNTIVLIANGWEVAP